LNNFYLRIRPKILTKIINDNRIKSVFETGGGATVGGIETRKTSIKELFNSSIKNVALNELPKYGYLGTKSKLAEFTANADMVHHYGSVLITLKKENFINRTTLTIGDSINFGDFYYKIPTFVSEPKIVALKGKLIREENLKKGFVKQRTFEFYLDYFYSLIANKKLVPTAPFKLMEFFEGSGFEFFELQFHGEIVFDRDVERIDFFAQTSGEKEEIEKNQSKLDEKKIPYKTVGFY
jgi:hypothetical protein